jgi:hypothetical protein
MKATPKRNKPKTAKKTRTRQIPLEDAHREIFVGPVPNSTPRVKLSMYKSVPSVTTYGLVEKPA